MNKILQNKTLYFLLSLVLITIPFPNYSFNSKAIILFAIFWLFYNSFQEKLLILKTNKKQFLSVSLILLIYFIGLLSSNDITVGIKIIGKRSLFLIIPLLIFTIKIDSKIIKILFCYFSISVMVASLLALFKAFYFKYNNLGSYLAYSDFGKLLEKHTTYFALFVVVATLYFLNQFMSKKKIITLLFVIYLVVLLYLLSVRVSIIAVVLGAYILFTTSKKNLYYPLLSILLVVVFYLSPNFQKRFNGIQSNTEMMFDFNHRINQLKININAVNEKNIVLGIGTGSDRTDIYNKYKQQNIMQAYKEKYNAHNQFIEYYVYSGMIGLLLFIGLLYLLYKSLDKANYFYRSIFIIFLVFMMTESILERQSGVILFTSLISLMIHTNPSKNNHNL